MSNIVLIVAYFGKFPMYKNLFFDSIKNNKTIDFLLITDQDVDFSISNLKILKMSFENFKSKIQNKLGFNIRLEKPYKIADYKPLYGYVFRDELIQYDFWGNIDLDVIFGNIRKFIPEDKLKKIDKVNELGHFTLYRNNENINKTFMSNEGMSYKKVFSTDVICVFDEQPGIQKKFDLAGIPSYNEHFFIDVDPFSFRMHDVGGINYDRQIFEYDGKKVMKVFVENGKIHKKEVMYIHFQKRNISIDFNCFDSKRKVLVLSQNGFDLIPNVDDAYIYENTKFNVFKTMLYYYKKVKYIWIRRYKKYVLKR